MSSILNNRLDPRLSVLEDGTIFWDRPLLKDYNVDAYQRGHKVTAEEFNREHLQHAYQGNFIIDTLQQFFTNTFDTALYKKLGDKYYTKAELAAIFSDYYTKTDINTKLNNYVLAVDAANTLDLNLDETTYILTMSLKDASGRVLSTKSVDFPLESVVVSGTYNAATKQVVLTLKNGSTVAFSVADLVSGLQTEITATNKLSADLISEGTTNKLVSQTEKNTWNSKQAAISDLATIRSGAGKGATAVQPNDLKTFTYWVSADGYIQRLDNNKLNISGGMVAGNYSPLTGSDIVWDEFIRGSALTPIITAHNNLTDITNLLTEKVEDLQLYKFPNATIIGEPVINNGQVSGFSSTDYLQFSSIVDMRGKSFVIDFEFVTGNNVTTQQNVIDSFFGIALAIQNGHGVMAISSNGTSWDIGAVNGSLTIQPNTVYKAKLAWDGSTYTTHLSTDSGQTYIQDMVVQSNLAPYPRTIFIGGSYGLFGVGTAHPWLGSINMNKAMLTIDGLVVWTGMDDVGLATRANVSLSNLDEEGIQVIKDNAGTVVDIGSAQFIEAGKVFPSISVEDCKKIFASYQKAIYQVLDWTLYGTHNYLAVVSTDVVAGTYFIDVLVHNEYHIAYSWTESQTGYANHDIIKGGSGTTIKIHGETQNEVSFTLDPQTQLDNKANKEDSVYFVQGSSSTAGNTYTSTKWEGTIPNVPTAYDGLKILYRIAGNPAVYNAGAALSIDGTHYYPVVYGVNTLIGQRYPVGSVIMLCFNASQTAQLYTGFLVPTIITGCWQIMDYDSDVYLKMYNLDTTNADRALVMQYDTTTPSTSGTNKYGAVSSNIKANPVLGQIKAIKFTENGVDLESKYLTANISETTQEGVPFYTKTESDEKYAQSFIELNTFNTSYFDSGTLRLFVIGKLVIFHITNLHPITTDIPHSATIFSGLPKVDSSKGENAFHAVTNSSGTKTLRYRVEDTYIKAHYTSMSSLDGVQYNGVGMYFKE